MKNSNPLEKDIEKKVVEYAKSLGLLSYKFTSPAKRSVPDRIFITPKGHVFFMEVKRRGCKPTPAQEVEIMKLIKQRANVYVVDLVENGKAVIDLELFGE